MSVIIEDQSFGITCVTWKCDMSYKSGSPEKVNFELKQIPCHTSYLEISWASHNQHTYRWDAYSLAEHSVSFHLKEFHGEQRKISQLLLKQSKKRNAIPDYYHQPHAVWVTVDGGHFKESSKVFLSEECKPLDDHVAALWSSIFGISEFKAAKLLTDYFFLQQKNCDVYFCFTLGEKIGGHISILSATSPVFAAMFKHNMKESQTGEVHIKDFERDIFYELLHYIYSGRTYMPMTEAIAQSLIEAAEKYNIRDLKNVCVGFLSARMTEATAQSIFEVADRHFIWNLKEECIQILIPRIELKNVIPLIIWADQKRAQKVKDAALNFIKKNFPTVCLSKDYEDLMVQFPDLCLEATRCMYR